MTRRSASVTEKSQLTTLAFNPPDVALSKGTGDHSPVNIFESRVIRVL